MRFGQDPSNRQFADWLLDVGHGRENATSPEDLITLPPDMNSGENISKLIDALYPGVNVPQPDKYFTDRTILSARNDDVDEINDLVLSNFPGERKIFQSADTAEVLRDAETDEELQYPPEYLNTINVSGLPLAKLSLKVGSPVMILRNINPAQGLCNGTRAIITQMTARVLEVRILGGQFAGSTAFLPRVTIIPSDANLPFQLRRRQFPVRLAFAMTINKSQGQSVKHVGLDLRTHVFTHGQFYVAVSCCTSRFNIKVLLKEEEQEKMITKNIVFKEVLID
jgi:ATP-dependent exoDNAse (exonuclease V) alpha subunit